MGAPTKNVLRLYSFAFKALLPLLFCCLALEAAAQSEHTIRVPTKAYSAIAQGPASDALDVGHIMDEIAKYAKLAERVACAQKLKPIIDKHLRAEMKTLKKGTPYSLTVDYETCEFIALLPSLGSGELSSKTSTVYRITLYQEVMTPPVLKPKARSAAEAPLLATFKDANGQWTAMGPYLTTDPFPTEKEAIGSLFYTDANLVFLCKRGKFNIYKLTAKVERDAVDVRGALMQLGVKDIPVK